MESMYSEVPLALAAMFLLVGSGSFIVIPLVLYSSQIDERALKYIDSLSAMPCLAAILGFVAGFFALQDETVSIELLFEPSALTVSTVSACFGLAVAIAAAVHGVFMLVGKDLGEKRRYVSLVMAGLSLCFVCSFSISHMATSNMFWGSFATLGQMTGCALTGGVALTVLMFEKAEALTSCRVRRLLAVALLIGVLLGLGCFVLELIAAADMSSAVLDLDVVQRVSMQVTVSCFCFVASFVFALMAIYSKESGFHSVVAVACSFVAVFCTLLVFYSLQMTTGA